MRIEGFVADLQMSWGYLGRFAFVRSGGRSSLGQLQLEAVTFLPGQRLLIYKDESWFKAYPPQGRGCKELSELADASIPIKSGVLSDSAFPLYNTYVNTRQPTFYFLAWSRCAESITPPPPPPMPEGCELGSGLVPTPAPAVHVPQHGTIVYFKWTTTNPGGLFRAHFSADEQGLFELHIGMAGSLLLISCVLARVICQGRTYEFLGSKQQVCLLVAICLLCAEAFSISRCALYASDGIERHSLLVAADVFESVGSTVLLVLLLLLCKGWAIVRLGMKLSTRLCQASAVLLAGAGHIAAMLVHANLHESAAAYSRWEHWQAHLPTVVVRLVVLLWFWRSIVHSYHKYRRSARRFFLLLCGIGSAWLLAPVLSVGLARLLPPHLRRSVLGGFIALSNLVTLILCACLALPTNLNILPYMSSSRECEIP